MEYQAITQGVKVGAAELRVISATSARLPIGPRPTEGPDLRARSRYLFVSHPKQGLVLVDGGAGPSMVPSRGRGLTPVGLFTPWEFLSTIERSPIDIASVVVTGPAADRLSNLDRLPHGIPIHATEDVIRRARGRGVSRALARFSGPVAELGRVQRQLRAVTWLAVTTWQGVEGFDLYGDGSCLLLPLTDRPGGHLALLMPRVEGLSEPLIWLTRPDLRIASETGRQALGAMPAVVRTLMKLGARVMHSADPDTTVLDVIEI